MFTFVDGSTQHLAIPIRSLECYVGWAVALRRLDVRAVWEGSGMEVLRSALKHGCTVDDIRHAVVTARNRVLVGEDPDRWFYIGVDPAGRALEIVTVMGEDGETVIHAMKLRKQYWALKGGAR